MASGRRSIVVPLSIGGSLILATTKFVAAALSGSSALIADGLVSASGAIQTGLLFIGLRRSRPPGGREAEVFFWTLLSASMIFSIPGAGSVLQGIQRLLDPASLSDVHVSYIVLAIAATVDVVVLIPSIRELRRERGDEGFWRSLRRSRNITTVVVFLGEATAVLGVMLAALGLVVSERTGNAAFDAMAATVVGLMWMLFASLVIYRCRELLVDANA